MTRDFASTVLSKIKKVLISIFAVLNIGTVLFINAPSSFRTSYETNLYSTMASFPQLAYKIRISEWLIRHYAHLAGLDNQWLMFTTLHRFNWWYVIKAQYADSSQLVLPLPGQSPRTFWQKNFVDFRVAKFHLNLYDNQPARKAYAYYLCQQYPFNGESPIQSIVIERHYQRILEPAEAAKRNTHLEAASYGSILDSFPCPI